RPSPSPQPAAAQGQPTTTQPAAAPAGRAEGEAAAARQPTRAAEPATRQLPMPPRHAGAPAPVQGPPTQAIDQPAQSRS
ncbi:MAG: hypothetical protein AVDCRST_MAG57-2186, partial [uncultured Blastococcus sp.]